MQLFKSGTTIHSFSSFRDFAQTFGLSESDLVITNSFLYEPFMKELNLKCHFVMQEKYGMGEPSEIMMNNILKDIQSVEYNRVIGIGGGTVIDVSKLFVLEGLKDVTDAFERKIPLKKCKKLVILPTTCGTGSEVTNISIAEITTKKTKMGLADDTILADDAVLVPELLKGLPFNPYAAASIDALIHAVESYVSPKANPYTRMFSRTAIEMIIPVFISIADKGQEDRFNYLDEMLMAANFAGVAFGNAGVGAVHALSYPLGGNYHVPHGESNYQLFTVVFKHYIQKNPNGKYMLELKEILGNLLECTPEEAFDTLDILLSKLIPKKQLKEYGMKPEEVRGFAEAVIATQQRLLANNYVEFSVDEIETIYAERY